MLFVEEDGSGVADATTYNSIQDTIDYLTVFHPDSSWLELEQSRQEASLMRASAYFDSMLKWRSTLLDEAQGLMFPRVPFVDTEGRTVEGLPTIIKQAVSEIANTGTSESLTKKAPLLLEQQFGDSRERYAAGYTEGTDGTLDSIRLKFSRLGYGVSNTTIIESYRA